MKLDGPLGDVVKRFTVEVNEDMADRNHDGSTGWRKTQRNWVVEIGGRMPRIEVVGDTCLRRPGPTRGCRADDDDDDDECTYSICVKKWRSEFVYK